MEECYFNLQAKACKTSPWVFSRFLNCTNDTKSRNAYMDILYPTTFVRGMKYFKISQYVVQRCHDKL